MTAGVARANKSKSRTGKSTNASVQASRKPTSHVQPRASCTVGDSCDPLRRRPSWPPVDSCEPLRRRPSWWPPVSTRMAAR